jgi:hypothetical protein
MTSILENIISEDFTLLNTDKRFSKTQQHSSLVLDRQKDIFYWNSKNIIGNVYVYLIKIRGYTKSQALEVMKSVDENPFLFIGEEEEKKEEVVQYSPLVEIFYEYGKKYGDYWHDKRGYTNDTIAEFKLGFTGTWYTIPIFENGKFVNFQARKDNPKTIKHWYKGVGPHSFNFSILKITNWVVITEGPVDAIMLRQHNIPAVSQTGGSGHWDRNWNPLFATKKRIYVVYDNDDAGKYHGNVVANQWGRRSKVYNFEGQLDKYDITDYFKAGGTRDSFMALLEKESKHACEQDNQ